MDPTSGAPASQAPSPAPLLRCEHLCLSYDGLRQAVADVSFTVHAGSIFALLGPNGAGKTSTLRMLATLTDPTSGRIVVDGIDAASAPDGAAAVRSRIGYLPDNFALYENLTAIDYLEFFARCYGVPAPERRRRAEALLVELDLVGKRTAPINSLSRGMRQRLGLAKTLIHQPKVLLLDEPASALDPGARLKLRDVLLGLKRRGLAIVISSHILPDLAGLADAVGIMEAGRMVHTGPVEEVARATTRACLVYAVEVSANMERAERAIGEFGPRLKSHRVSPLAQGARFEVELEGGTEAVADLVESMVLRGARVVHVAPLESALESIYRASGALQVS
ncbi:MAG TPA: ABC transporter ATP-binding protein [Polyangia bacterium]|nr:ABC transporter ATP-binding protein [Polyangia bacterium]